jgi:hypothetical protein
MKDVTEDEETLHGKSIHITILIFVGYADAGMNAFTLQLTPHAGSCVNL